MKITFNIIISFFLLVSIASSVSGLEFKISPENPVVGDDIKMTGNASPGEVIQPSITFKETVNVAEGNNKYEYQINGIEIPPGMNTFAVSAQNVQNLNVGVKLLIWWTISADAANGVATISQGNVPGGTYHVKMFGTAVDGASSVPLTITASTRIKADDQGNFRYEISTDKLPAGKYTLNIGGKTETITLLAHREKPKETEKPERQENEDRGKNDRHEVREDSTSVSVTPTPETTEKTPESTPEIKETPVKTPEDTPAHNPEQIEHETFLQRILKWVKFW